MLCVCLSERVGLMAPRTFAGVGLETGPETSDDRVASLIVTRVEYSGFSVSACLISDELVF